MEKIKFLENMDNIENRENDVQLKYNLVELRVLESSMKQINPLIINNKKLKLNRQYKFPILFSQTNETNSALAHIFFQISE